MTTMGNSDYVFCTQQWRPHGGPGHPGFGVMSGVDMSTDQTPRCLGGAGAHQEPRLDIRCMVQDGTAQ